MKLLFHSESGPGALPPLSVSGPGALCVGFRHSLALCVRPRRSLCRASGLCRLRRSLAVGGPALSVSGPALCRGHALCVSEPGLCVGPLALSVSGPGALCFGPRRSLAMCVARPDALSLSVSGPNTLRFGPRRSLCRGPGPSVSGPCRGPALLWPGALCVGTRRSLCRVPALSVSGPRRSLAVGPDALCLCVGARRSALSAGPSTHPLRMRRISSPWGEKACACTHM